MQLIPNWKVVIVKGWSCRFIFLSGAFSSIEILLPLFATKVTPGVFAGLSLLTTGAAFWARLTAQKGITHGAK